MPSPVNAPPLLLRFSLSTVQIADGLLGELEREYANNANNVSHGRDFRLLMQKIKILSELTVEAPSVAE